MKKRSIIVLISVLVCLLVMGGCGGQNVTLDTEAAAETLTALDIFDEPLEKMDNDVARKLYQVEEDTVKNMAVYTGTAAVVDEVSVWEAKDAAAATKIEEAIKSRIESQKTSYASYRPEEVPKLENAVTVRRGNYVVFCVSKDSGQASAAIEALWQSNNSK
ncbi:DUF4358 domain-containing protein [Ructibacterium gallinarum]|uniref:DUF4358 domain-containing protein n=1 Tax=Ructibacterium gallinarum TaxID=2779355 RepID=A0A9D5R7S0_9FIRM|nr:DUF4358 domain-containing protein [Ructibacterium gallinarum]MBE5039536.1 DUF4358 domain-containing protein [Ructibacterium gallinarum]